VRGHDGRSDAAVFKVDFYRQQVSLNPASRNSILINKFATRRITKTSASACWADQLGESHGFWPNQRGHQSCK
jgi:hypothetical protein